MRKILGYILIKESDLRAEIDKEVERRVEKAELYVECDSKLGRVIRKWITAIFFGGKR